MLFNLSNILFYANLLIEGYFNLALLVLLHVLGQKIMWQQQATFGCANSYVTCVVHVIQYVCYTENRLVFLNNTL